MDEETKNKKENYITLFEAAKLCSYSEPYLRLRARQGKFKSIKLGKKWMTTAAWVADYEKRVAVWKETSEARKIVPTAVFVSAPKELTGNLVHEVSSEITTEAREEELVVSMRPATPVWDFTKEDDLPTMPSRMPLARFATGQILPVPQETKIESDDNHFVWFGALVSGALSALILAVAASSGSGGVDLAVTAEKFAQANASLAVVENTNGSGTAAGLAVDAGTVVEDVKEQFSSDRLKEFVEKTAEFFNSLDMTGW